MLDGTSAVYASVLAQRAERSAAKPLGKES
jgi:hypothetical protein